MTPTSQYDADAAARIARGHLADINAQELANRNAAAALVTLLDRGDKVQKGHAQVIYSGQNVRLLENKAYEVMELLIERGAEPTASQVDSLACRVERRDCARALSVLIAADARAAVDEWFWSRLLRAPGPNTLKALGRRVRRAHSALVSADAGRTGLPWGHDGLRYWMPRHDGLGMRRRSLKEFAVYFLASGTDLMRSVGDRHLERLPESWRALAELSTHQHGRLKLIGLESDLEALIARPDTGCFYGLESNRP